MGGGYREHWLDLAKGIGIILVVWAHAISREAYLWVLINQFHMPLFFMISGYLYKTKENWGKFLIGKIRSLWLPYVVSSLITIIISVLLGAEGGGLVFWLKKIIKVCLLLEAGPLLGATWFLQVLFYAIIIYDLIVRVARRTCRTRAEMAMSAIAIICLLVGILTHLPFRTSVILNTVFFLHFGQMVKNHRKWEDWKLLVFLVLLGVCAGISAVNRTSYTTNTYTYPLLFVIGAVAGSVGVIGICRKIYRENKVYGTVSWMGQNSIGPLIWQFVTFKIVIAAQIAVYQLPWSRIGDFPVIYEYASGLWVLLDIIVGIGVSMLIYKLINKPVDKLATRAEKRLLGRLSKKAVC